MTEPAPEIGERQQPREEPSVEMVAPEGGLQVVYANNASVKTSFWDLLMDFGQIEEVTEQRVVVRNQVRVLMSPQHARAFADVLAKNIANYEERFGSIPIPPETEDGQVGTST